MSKLIARTPIYAGEHAIFASTVCKQLLGKQIMGGRVIAAKQTKPDEIWLTFEIELDVISTEWFIPEIEGNSERKVKPADAENNPGIYMVDFGEKQ